MAIWHIEGNMSNHQSENDLNSHNYLHHIIFFPWRVVYHYTPSAFSWRLSSRLWPRSLLIGIVVRRIVASVPSTLGHRHASQNFFFFFEKRRRSASHCIKKKEGKSTQHLQDTQNTTHTHTLLHTDTPKMAAKRPTQIQNTNLQGDGLTRGKGLGLLLWSTTGAPPQPLLKP